MSTVWEAMVAQLNPWDIEGSLVRLKERLRPLYKAAARRPDRVFINLDMVVDYLSSQPD